MRFILLPGTFAACVAIGGAGLSMVLPEQQKFIGYGLIVIAIGILVFSIRLEDGSLSIGRKNPLKSWWWALSRRRVSLHEAAQLAYEAMERSGLDDMTSSSYSSPEVMLNHMKYVFLSAAKKGAITLHGARPPSRQSLPIPADEVGQLHPQEGSNNLRSLSRSTPHDFHDVWLSRRDLGRTVRDRIGLLERVNEGLQQ